MSNTRQGQDAYTVFVWKRPTLRLIVLAALGILAMLFVQTVRDPLVRFEDAVMRQSEMRAVATTAPAIYCQQMASYSFDVSYTCFDSMAELDAFNASRSAR